MSKLNQLCLNSDVIIIFLDHLANAVLFLRLHPDFLSIQNSKKNLNTVSKSYGQNEIMNILSLLLYLILHALWTIQCFQLLPIPSFESNPRRTLTYTDTRLFKSCRHGSVRYRRRFSDFYVPISAWNCNVSNGVKSPVIVRQQYITCTCN